MLFTGEYACRIDAKGRLAIPSAIQRRLSPVEDGEAFYLTLGPGRTLRLYPERAFERLASKSDDGLVADESVREFEQLFFPLSSRLPFDGAGRVLLPERMLARAGLSRDVVLIGVRDHLEVRDPEQWEAEIEERLAKQADIFKQYHRTRTRQGES